MNRHRTRNFLIGLGCALAFQVPMLAFWHSGRSEFLNYWEFACYRYYTALSILNGHLQNIWVVQGMPMAWLQNFLVGYLSECDPQNLGSVAQINLFATATAWTAYLISGLLLLGTWCSDRWPTADKACISAAALGIWPMTRHYTLLLAPDYWIYEVPFYIVSTLWVLRLAKRHQDGTLMLPGHAFFAAAGVWAGVAFLQKPSLAAFALLPAVAALALATGGSVPGRITRAALALVCAAASNRAFFAAYYNFQWTRSGAAYQRYWDWLVHHADTGTSLLTLPQLLKASNFLFVPIVLGLLFLLALSWATFRREPVMRDRWRQLAVIGFIWLAAIGHIGVIGKRPSGTSVVDAMFFGAFLLPICIRMAPATVRGRFAAAFAVLLAAGCLFYHPGMFGSWTRTDESGTLATIEHVRRDVLASKRPVVLLLPDNRIHPMTAEAFGLYTGQLDLEPQENDDRTNLPRPMSKDSLRQRLFPNTFMINRGQNAQLSAAIDAGFLIMWGEAMNAPRIQDFFPEIDSLVARPDASHETFIMIPGGVVKAHLAYRRDVKPFLYH